MASRTHVPSSSPPRSTTRRDPQAGWELCQTIQTLMWNKQLDEAFRDLPKLPLSSISPRRAAHVILHGLVRKGSVSEASFYAQHSINRGINMRKQSIEAIVIGMVHSAEAQPPAHAVEPIVPLGAPTILDLAPATNQNPDLIRSALSLYEAERMSGKRPSDRLFKYLMVLCILNGEIILASLLFGSFMREWQARDMANRVSANAPDTQPAPNHLMTQLQIRQMCHFLKEFLKSDYTDPTSLTLHSVSLQALAQLAHTLDHGRLQYGDVNFLLKTLLLCPRGPAMVWIPGNSPDDPPQHVNAYKYIHDVMERVISDLPARRRDVEEYRHANFTWFNGRDYVKLVEYSLKHRHSLDVTRKLMQHIAEESPEILKLAELRNVVMHAAPAFPPGVIYDLMAEFRLPVMGLEWDPNATDYSYSTAINALMKAGESKAVMNAIPDLLPGLFLPAHDETLSISENRLICMDLEEEGLRRGVILGPVVFVCLMNAARSLGNVKFCERIFRFALAAQERSWLPGSGFVPWCLPVHAYTLMVRMYAHEMTFDTSKMAHKWGTWKPGDEVSRPEMGRQMLLATVRLMVKEARLLEDRVRWAKRWARPAWRNIPQPDGFFFNALIEAFQRTPDDPAYLALKSEMEAEGFRPPAAYLESLKLRKGRVHDEISHKEPLGGEQRSWREPKDIRPYALPKEDYFKAKHEPALFTKHLTKRMGPFEADE
ncbi:hypothetical protein D9619_001166 [Psilocybe cf. subviscida]|uniref:Uncharacterized protein n=1 Tax=Psilocybe cf. subviscida TaxID=2480587 RepID=A0A8H5F2J9_9AGAR|nr:hypothetical protein D9619_001166 [Psilocybe cf. subviscida]